MRMRAHFYKGKITATKHLMTTSIVNSATTRYLSQFEQALSSSFRFHSFALLSSQRLWHCRTKLHLVVRNIALSRIDAVLIATMSSFSLFAQISFSLDSGAPDYHLLILWQILTRHLGANFKSGGLPEVDASRFQRKCKN